MMSRIFGCDFWPRHHFLCNKYVLVLLKPSPIGHQFLEISYFNFNANCRYFMKIVLHENQDAIFEIILPNCELGARLRERLPDHQFMTVKLSIIYIIKGILRRWDLHLSNYCPWDIYGPSLLGFFLPGEIFDFFYLIYSDHSLQILKSFFVIFSCHVSISLFLLLSEGVIWS